MPLRDSTATYGALTRLLHWILFLSIAIQFLLALSFGWWPQHSHALKLAVTLHESVGLLIFVFGALFIIWRWLNPKPSLQDDPLWQRGLAKFIHVVIYIAVIAQPVFGLLWVMTHGHSVPFFGWFHIPQLVPNSKTAARLFGTLHAFTGWWILLIALAIHLAASLYHHFIRKDGVLRRMLTGDGL